MQFWADRNFSHRALILWFAAIIILLTLSLSNIAYAHPVKESSCTACHTLNDPDASISVFIDNVGTTSIEFPNDGTASLCAVAAQTNARLGIGAHETFALRFKVKVK